jgi:hypothetical protein
LCEDLSSKSNSVNANVNVKINGGVGVDVSADCCRLYGSKAGAFQCVMQQMLIMHNDESLTCTVARLPRSLVALPLDGSVNTLQAQQLRRQSLVV